MVFKLWTRAYEEGRVKESGLGLKSESLGRAVDAQAVSVPSIFHSSPLPRWGEAAGNRKCALLKAGSRILGLTLQRPLEFRCGGSWLAVVQEP
jgi:hypothetical protein